MHILEVRLSTAMASAAAEFYGAVLELPVAVSRDRVDVRVGTTMLRLTESAEPQGTAHLAFTIPRNRFAEAKRWLAERVSLLDFEGRTEFRLVTTWHSESVYFEGPDGIILELIARHRLDNDSDEPFTSADILNVSEVGLAVTDVPATVTAFEEQLGLVRFGDGSDEFAPIGDHDGLFILVTEGRPWFPTKDRPAGKGPAAVLVSAPRSGVVSSATGWRVDAR